ncbi:MAG: HD domain-containing protein [Anaerolineae bacterium]
MAALADRIAVAEGADRLVVRAAALLHDVARMESDHHLRSAEQARTLLRGYPPEFVEAVAHAIEAHRFRHGPEPKTLEAQCLFDADKLDAIGAIGIARAFAYAGRANQRLWAPLETAASDSDTEHTPVHEFAQKLSRLRDLLYTRTAREIAAERHEFMLAFFRRLEEEVQGLA